jgi:Flp pilus assembly secretin CpaC
VNRSRNEQVELGVTVAELNRTALENEGFDFHIFQNKIFVNANLTLIQSGSISDFYNRGAIDIAAGQTFSVTGGQFDEQVDGPPRPSGGRRDQLPRVVGVEHLPMVEDHPATRI